MAEYEYEYYTNNIRIPNYSLTSVATVRLCVLQPKLKPMLMSANLPPLQPELKHVLKKSANLVTHNI